jgi:predicted RNA-binding Zn-ribbon protein involved in translation (DUF1610 family)
VMSELTHCPACGAKIAVRDTDARETIIIRVRRCAECRYEISTEEHVVAVVNPGGQPQPSA